MTLRRLLLPAAVLVAALSVLTPFAQRPEETPQPRPVAPRGALEPHEQALVGLFESAAPSVAYIYTERLERTGFFTQGLVPGAGSGFVWDGNGHVVTNYHVVEGARTVKVALDVGDPIPAKVIGVAPDYDLAVVKLEKVPKDIKPIPVGTSKDLRIGQTVYAIGNPFGLSRTLTQGIVSALDRHLPTTHIREIAGAIQTDAAINPGNSGGPLLDSAGRLVGVNSQIRASTAQSSGVGLAIPVDMVNRVVPALIATGRAPQPGIGIQPADPFTVARAGIRGVVVVNVNKDSPAEKAGIVPLDMKNNQMGDIITAVNGRAIESLPTFAAELDRAGIGSTAELTVIRDGKERKVPVKVVDLAK